MSCLRLQQLQRLLQLWKQQQSVSESARAARATTTTLKNAEGGGAKALTRAAPGGIGLQGPLDGRRLRQLKKAAEMATKLQQRGDRTPSGNGRDVPERVAIGDVDHPSSDATCSGQPVTTCTGNT